MDSKTIAICLECKSKYIVGTDCDVCSMNKNINTVKYAVALKSAITCWNEAGCKDHEIPCKATLKEFAQEFFEFQTKIEKLEKAIRTHKYKNVSPDENDLELYKSI